MFKTKSTKGSLDLNVRKMIVPGMVMLAFLTLGAVIWLSTGVIMPLFFFGYIGTSVGIGLGLYAALPKKKKPLGRRLSLILVGTFLVGFAAIYGQENMQIEGAFFGLLGGVTQAAVVHYLIAKIFGPMLFGRIWCGWACWTVMVLRPAALQTPRRALAWQVGLDPLPALRHQPGSGCHSLVCFRFSGRRNGEDSPGLVHHRQHPVLCRRYLAGL